MATINKPTMQALEALEKKLTDRMTAMEDSITGKMEDMMDKILNKMANKIDEKMAKLKEELIGQVKEVKKDTEDLKEKTTKMTDTINTMDQTVDKLRRDARTNEDRLLRLECQATSLQLRLRGVPESLKEDKQVMAQVFAEYLELQPEAVLQQLDGTYRINSEYAKQKNLPRDVIVQFVTRSLKEEIIRKQYQEQLEIENVKIRVMRELPRRVLQIRKDYKALTDKLKAKKIRFRWEIPRGMVFDYAGQRMSIITVDQMQEFLDNWED